MADRLSKLAQHLHRPADAAGCHHAAASASSAASAPQASAAPLTITAVDSFVVECPLTEEQARVMADGQAKQSAGPGRAPFVGCDSHPATWLPTHRDAPPLPHATMWSACLPEACHRADYNSSGVTRIRTSDPAITGYGWAECPEEQARELLLGKDPMMIEQVHPPPGAAGLPIDPISSVAALCTVHTVCV